MFRRPLRCVTTGMIAATVALAVHAQNERQAQPARPAQPQPGQAADARITTTETTVTGVIVDLETYMIGNASSLTAARPTTPGDAQRTPSAAAGRDADTTGPTHQAGSGIFALKTDAQGLIILSDVNAMPAATSAAADRPAGAAGDRASTAADRNPPGVANQNNPNEPSRPIATNPVDRENRDRDPVQAGHSALMGREVRVSGRLYSKDGVKFLDVAQIQPTSVSDASN